MSTPKNNPHPWRKMTVLIGFFVLAVFLFVSSEQTYLQQIITPEQATEISQAAERERGEHEARGWQALPARERRSRALRARGRPAASPRARA